MESKRVVGLVYGLCAGDRNGGPQRMAMRIAESVLHAPQPQPSVPGQRMVLFNRADLICRYMSWMVGGVEGRNVSKQLQRALVVEPEQAYDTGVVFDNVFQQLIRVLPPIIDKKGEEEVLSSTPKLGTIIDELAMAEYGRRQSAGVSPAHRNVVLSCFPSLDSDPVLAAASRCETTISHLHQEAIDTAVATNLIARKLIKGISLRHAVSLVLQPEDKSPSLVSDELLVTVLSNFVNKKTQYPSHDGGRSPLVLEAALYFLDNSANFADALNNSLGFAGPANYCPVLVGSLGGALYSIDDETLMPCVLENREFTRPRHHKPKNGVLAHSDRIKKLTDDLVALW